MNARTTVHRTVPKPMCPVRVSRQVCRSGGMSVGVFSMCVRGQSMEDRSVGGTREGVRGDGSYAGAGVWRGRGRPGP